MAVRGVGARASGRLGLLSILFISAWCLPTGSGFQITSIGTLAQCVPTLITWDIGQSLPPFTISIGIASSSTDGPLLFTGLEGTSATITLNLPPKTRIDLALVNSGGVLNQQSNLVIAPGTDSSCANGALSGSVTNVASIPNRPVPRQILLTLVRPQMQLCPLPPVLLPSIIHYPHLLLPPLPP